MPPEPDVVTPQPERPAPPAARNPDATLGWLAVLAGTALAFGVQLVAPVGVPLYDGVAVQEPYRYLHPTGGQPGSPSSFSAAPAVEGGVSPQVAAATLEAPPQAQLIMLPDALSLAPGATSLDVAITPVDPPAVPPGGQIAGNVYRFSVTDQSGTPVTIKPCEGCISLVLRAPEDTGAARLQRFADGVWADVETVHAGIVGLYSTNPTRFGDYAVVTGGTPGGEVPDEGLGFEQLAVAGGAAVLLVLLFAAALLTGRRQPPSPAPVRPRTIPSKRKRPNHPPPGRPDQ